MKKVISILVIVLVVSFFSGFAFATAQFPERINHNGEDLFMFSTPLSTYFSDNNPPPKIIAEGPYNTACWRRYVGSWKIAGGKLYLVKLHNCGQKGEEIPISAVFPDKTPPVEATWFTGTLRIPKGKRLRYVHMGFMSTYEWDLFVQIENGIVVKEWTVDNRNRVDDPRRPPSPGILE